MRSMRSQLVMRSTKSLLARLLASHSQRRSCRLGSSNGFMEKWVDTIYCCAGIQAGRNKRETTGSVDVGNLAF